MMLVMVIVLGLIRATISRTMATDNKWFRKGYAEGTKAAMDKLFKDSDNSTQQDKLDELGQLDNEPELLERSDNKLYKGSDINKWYGDDGHTNKWHRDGDTNNLWYWYRDGNTNKWFRKGDAEHTKAVMDKLYIDSDNSTQQGKLDELHELLDELGHLDNEPELLERADNKLYKDSDTNKWYGDDGHTNKWHRDEDTNNHWYRDEITNKWFRKGDAEDISNIRVYGGRQHAPDTSENESVGGLGRVLNIVAGLLLIFTQIIITSAIYILLGWNL